MSLPLYCHFAPPLGFSSLNYLHRGLKVRVFCSLVAFPASSALYSMLHVVALPFTVAVKSLP